jgi:CTP synthase (UTP-ammonia lyase)
MTRIALIGEYDPASPNHAATNAALRHSSDRLAADVSTAWISTEALSDGLFEHVSAVLVAPGSPYKDLEKTLAAIRFAREHGVPCLGTCGGFQHMVIEYARNVLGVPEAQHAEYYPAAESPFITPLACSLAGRSMALTFQPDSKVAAAYGSSSATEQYFCNFGVDPSRVAQLKSGPLRVVGADAEGEVRIIELPDHPFFIGTLFQPQLRSLPGRPHPLVTAFVRAAIAAERARKKAL